MSLKEYKRKRDFSKTPEPDGQKKTSNKPLIFMVHKHAASRLHFDLRLELDGVFRSFAVPKGPSLNPVHQRLAVFVEDHPLEYGRFEGQIPEGNYGAGTVMIWDYGTYSDRKNPEDSEQSLLKDFARGQMSFILCGHRLYGEFILLRIKDSKNWLLMKKNDGYADYKTAMMKTSIVTGRTMAQIKSQASDKKEIWSSRKESRKACLKDFDFFDEKKSAFKKRIFTKELNKEGLEGSFETAAMEEFPSNLDMMSGVISYEIFHKEGFLYSPLFGGIRALLYMDGARVKLISKKAVDLTKRFLRELECLKKRQLKGIFHVEIFYQSSKDGKILRRRQEQEDTFICSIIDILHFNGKNLRDVPLLERMLFLSSFEPLKIKPLTFYPYSLNKCFDVEKSTFKNSVSSILCRELTSGYRSGISRYWHEIEPHKEEIIRHRPTNLSKIFFPELHLTKKDVLDYYEKIADYILPHLKDRPQSMNRFPNGIYGESFYHKDVLGYLPNFVSTVRIESKSKGSSLNYLLCQNTETLLYMVNLGCIEFHPFFSRKDSLLQPDFSVIDLDPDGHSYDVVVKVSLKVCHLLDELLIPYFIKTSGARGMHIVIPLFEASFNDSLLIASLVCSHVSKMMPKETTTKRSKAQRGGRLYLDALQNRKSSTIASVYSLRARSQATVSMPILKEELKEGLSPLDFTIFTALERLRSRGDLFLAIGEKGIKAKKCLRKLEDLEN